MSKNDLRDTPDSSPTKPRKAEIREEFQKELAKSPINIANAVIVAIIVGCLSLLVFDPIQRILRPEPTSTPNLSSLVPSLTPQPTASATVAPAPTAPLPKFSEIKFFISGDETDGHVNAKTEFPIGIRAVGVRIEYLGSNEIEYEVVTYEQGKETDKRKETIGPDLSLATTTLIDSAGRSLSEGQHRIGIYINGEYQTSGEFEVLWRPTIFPIAFSETIDTTTVRPINPTNEFTAGIREIYYSFDVMNFSHGQTYEVNVYVNGDLGIENPLTWTLDDESGAYANVIASSEALPTGNYRVEGIVNDVIQQVAEFTIK